MSYFWAPTEDQPVFMSYSSEAEAEAEAEKTYVEEAIPPLFGRGPARMIPPGGKYTGGRTFQQEFSMSQTLTYPVTPFGGDAPCFGSWNEQPGRAHQARSNYVPNASLFEETSSSVPVEPLNLKIRSHPMQRQRKIPFSDLCPPQPGDDSARPNLRHLGFAGGPIEVHPEWLPGQQRLESKPNPNYKGYWDLISRSPPDYGQPKVDVQDSGFWQNSPECFSPRIHGHMESLVGVVPEDSPTSHAHPPGQGTGYVVHGPAATRMTNHELLTAPHIGDTGCRMRVPLHSFTGAESTWLSVPFRTGPTSRQRRRISSAQQRSRGPAEQLPSTQGMSGKPRDPQIRVFDATRRMEPALPKGRNLTPEGRDHTRRLKNAGGACRICRKSKKRVRYTASSGQTVLITYHQVLTRLGERQSF
ncbi:hypothetical protein MMC24_005044 [Lignoscripta atroalba]|nr:hypothetical protein [Lignoscripta atroalba]